MNIDRKLLSQVIAIAKKAGQESLKIYNAEIPLQIKTKLDDSPVTIADMQAHEFIKAALQTLLPGIPVLSEEDPEHLFETRQGWELFWLIDPIDGTREFISHTGQFTVNIALIYQNRPILGVIYLPLKNRTYAGADTIPTFKEEEGKVTTVNVRPWQKGDEITLLTTRKQMSVKLRYELAKISPITLTYRSSSVKFCMLAEGRADIYLRTLPIREWDTAAGQAIVEYAGGVVLDSNWQALRYNTKPYLLNSPFIALGDSQHLLPILKEMPIFEEN